ncbi:bifunctional folylpolyglutamate synthase/dihydrofolate synthase [Carboxydothermus ferrireducens]|uniref:tetrahydrofolate synthase n=1 Tax=Carboxydothermus ferrireducens DSM 11255 TaxID=1119529 RepID=A0ABX2R7X0_9THEO|nr:folylpolyglutamate synthase/dihydrofolate synthase family protein [Carboxydothermus ferrireducens]NYE57274.1 dihydrofolate synthase/folylpolyglutamate synthase [Carboxydothermus ferrireducens DSM 11255]
MNYNEALEFLSNLTKFGINLGLGRISELLKRLGNPQEKVKVVHIGGTNGKGSVCSLTASVLAEAGYKTGLFTSPHLSRYTERYKINGKEISPERVSKLVMEIRPLLLTMVKEGFEHPTEFEVSTAMAFKYFAEEEVDFVVLEVGLGGLIDSTNVVSRPEVVAITNVGMDHMDYLGNTITEIARVKAGIIKPGVPVVTAATGEALEVIKEVAKEKNSPLLDVNKDIVLNLKEKSLKGQVFDLIYRGETYPEVKIRLLGAHQLLNAKTSFGILNILREKYNIPVEAIYRGFSNAAWPGRFEYIPGNPPVLLDGAHNHDGVRALRQAFTDYFPGVKPVLLLGVLADKEREKVVAELLDLPLEVVVTRPPTPRAGDITVLARLFKEKGVRVKVIEEPTEALSYGLEIAQKHQTLLLITGSLYMIGEIRPLLLQDRD